MSFCLPPADVVATNRRITEHLHRVTGPNELEGALARPNQTWDGDLLYPTLLQRAGVLLDGLVHAHAFFEGNKRTAWVSTIIYLEAFGAFLCDLPDQVVEAFVVSVAVHETDAAGAANWLAARLAT